MPSEDTKKPTTGTEIAEKILGEIEERRIKPTPRWVYATKEVFFWLAWFLATVVGSLAVATMGFVIKHSGWVYRQATHDSLIKFMSDFIPYLWLALLVVMVFAAYFLFRKTQKGYRLNFPVVILVSLLVSLIGGLILYFSCLGAMVEDFTGAHVPGYRSISTQQQEIWVNPERGLLAGEISFDGEGKDLVVSLEDFRGTVWILDVSDLADPDWGVIETFEKVRIVGVPLEAGSDTHVFEACFIFPWEFAGGSVERNFIIPSGVPSERKNIELRTTSCKGIKSFQALERLRELTQ